VNRLRQVLGSTNTILAGNVVARVGALACVFAATLVLARNGGPAVVGVYALLHVLPGLVGTVVSCGLPVATPYFLAGPDRDNRRLTSTLAAMALVGGTAGALLWMALTPVFGPLIFSDLSQPLVMLAGVLVLSRLLVITAKACSQGSEDLSGSNAVIFGEQFMFLPAYGLLWAAGVGGFGIVVGTLLLADAMTGTLAWARLARRGFFRYVARPSLQLARRIAGYGLRGQVGGVMSLLNLRLDFILLSAMTGPAVLGVYAVASKFAELIRILGMALQYVFYPTFAKQGKAEAAASARRLIPRFGLVSASMLVPLWFAAGAVIPAFYGSDFSSAVTPTRIILFGLALDGIAGVITGFLYGIGRPGLNSLAMAAGLAVTVALDLVLIPQFEATGAAIASAVAYTTTGLALLGFFWWVNRANRTKAVEEPAFANADTG
jgi:O-antigen/teichoic acid export membrane protein